MTSAQKQRGHLGLGFLIIILLTLGLVACGEEAKPTATTAPATTSQTTTTVPTTTSGSVTTSSTSTSVAVATTSGGVKPVTTTAATANSAKVGDTGLPLPGSFKVVKFGDLFYNLITPQVDSVLGNAGTGAIYQFYVSNENPTQISTFYNDAMPKAGYAALKQQDIPSTTGLNLGGKVLSYGKGGANGGTGAGVIILGPLDERIIGQLSPIDSAFGKDVKAGDNMVVLIGGVSLNSLSGGSTPAPTKK